MSPGALGAAPAPPCPPARLARAFGLFVALLVAADLGIAALSGAFGLLARPRPEVWRDAPLLVFFAHAAASIYDGRFDRPRGLTWPLLVCAWAGTELAGFLAYALPWGQLSFWFAARATALLEHVPLVGERLIAWLWNAGMPVGRLASVGLLFPAALVLDAAALHRPRRRADLFDVWRVGAAAVAAELALRYIAVPILTMDGISPPRGPGFTPFPVVPLWYELPFYALLRAVPDKLAGVAAMFGAMLLPAIWPLAGAARCRTGPARGLYRLLCAMLAVAVVALWWAGAQAPDDALLTARVAGSAYALFFALVPALSRLSRP